MSGLLASSDVANHLMVFLTNPESGELDYAHKVFDSLPDPSLFLYNLMIKALTKKGCPKSTLLLFYRMREATLSPDNFTYPFVLKAIASISIFSEGRKAHGLIVKSGFEFDPYVRDVVCWNVLIAVYVKYGKFEEAVAVFRMMEQERVEPDEATLVSTLSACIRLGNLELGKEIQRYMNERSRFSIPASNALLDLYVKCGCVDMARTLFDNLPAKNVISWTTMMSGYVSSGLLDEAQKLFDKSPTRDVVLWTAMINGYVQYNHFEEALAMSREMQMARIKPDKFTVVSLLTICANFGALEQGKWIHGYIEENMIKVDLVIATALMDMYAKCGSVEKSLEIFKRVERKDGAMWTSIICGHAMNGQTDKALELFSEMKREGVQLDDITFSGVLSACNHGGLVENGRRHFREMELYHIEPKPEHYACLVDLLGRAGLLDEAETLIRSLPSVNDGDVLPLWGALLGACRIHGNVDMGHRIAEELIDMVNHRVDERKLPPLINRPVTRSFGAILAINAAAAVADKRPVTSRDGGKGEVIIRPMPEEVIVISPDTVEVSSSRKKKVHTLTSVLIARSKLACGVTDKGKDSAHDIDALDRDDQLAVMDYVEDIYKFYKFSESSSRPRDYMGSQVEINSQMRAVLADWLIEVHQKFGLRPETLYLTFHIIDHYLSLESARKRELQLVGVSAMLIASKYEEIWAPEVKDFISISNKA